MIGARAIAIYGHHYDPGDNLSGSGAGAFFELVQRWKGLHVYLEGVPVVDTAHTTSPRFGALTQSFGLFNAVASVPVDRAHHLWAGMGVGVLAQRTPVLNYPYHGWDQVNSSRLAGTRYELQGRYPTRGGGFWDFTLAGLPSVHGNDSATLNYPGGMRHRSEGESAAMTDFAGEYGIRRGSFEYALGIRWINFSANYDNGVAADRNVGAGPTFTVLWSL